MPPLLEQSVRVMVSDHKYNSCLILFCTGPKHFDKGCLVPKAT